MARDPELQCWLMNRKFAALIHKYPRALDRQDHALLATLFHPDAIDEHGHYNGSASEPVDWMAAGAQPGVHWRYHCENKII
jgi:hypothetical protein